MHVMAVCVGNGCMCRERACVGVCVGKGHVWVRAFAPLSYLSVGCGEKHHVGGMRWSCGGHAGVMWGSCDGHVGGMRGSCGGHVMVMWGSCEGWRHEKTSIKWGWEHWVGGGRGVVSGEW